MKDFVTKYKMCKYRLPKIKTAHLEFVRTKLSLKFFSFSLHKMCKILLSVGMHRNKTQIKVK